MGNRAWVLGGALLAAAGAAQGQYPGQATIDKSSEKVVFFSGSVMLEDGTPPPDTVRIERICAGTTSFEAWTDEKGHFAFKVTPNESDVTTGDASLQGQGPTELGKAMNQTSTQYSMPISSMLRTCQLYAVLAGYRSESVSMAVKSMLDDTRVGPIILHPLSPATALTVSATTLAAPPNARKAFTRGLDDMRIGKWDAASGEFDKAVKTFPKFAAAWYQLGVARQNLNDASGAVAAWQQAVASDPHYVKPLENLTVDADHHGDWADSEKYAHLWLQLDAEDFPGAYLLSAVANARLGKPEEAEHAAREGLRVDKEQKIPRLNYVLGLILLEKKQYAESAKCFRKYLELAPNANDAAIVRQQLPKLEMAGK